MAMIDAIGLSKRFRPDRLALDHLSFTVNSGEVYCLLGPQGAGKSTAIGLLLGFVHATAGHATVGDHNPAEDPTAVKRITSYVGSDSSLYDGLTARQNVEFFTRLGGQRRIDRSAVLAAMRQFGIAERHFEQKVSRIAPELRLLIWLAITSLKETPILILDEPTIGLDSRASADLQEYLSDFKRQGKTILLATADLFLASEISDRIGILKDGRKVAERTRAHLLGQSLNELYFDYVGRPPRRADSAAEELNSLRN